MSATIEVSELIALIRKHQGIPGNKSIVESSLLEEDINITGDDGAELIEAIERELGFSFPGSDGSLRGAFGLADDQYLFQ